MNNKRGKTEPQIQATSTVTERWESWIGENHGIRRGGGASGSRKEREAGSQSRGVNQNQDGSEGTWEGGRCLSKKPTEIHGSFPSSNPWGFAFHTILLASGCGAGDRDPSFSLLCERHELGALERPGGLVLEKDDCAMYESLLFLEIASAFPRPCYSEIHTTNLILLIRKPIVFLLPVQFNTIQICEQVIRRSARRLGAECDSSVAKWLFLTSDKFPISYLAMMNAHNRP